MTDTETPDDRSLSNVDGPELVAGIGFGVSLISVYSGHTAGSLAGGITAALGVLLIERRHRPDDA